MELLLNPYRQGLPIYKTREQLWSKYLGIPTHVIAHPSTHSTNNYRPLSNHCPLSPKVRTRKEPVTPHRRVTINLMLLHAYPLVPVEPLLDLS